MVRGDFPRACKCDTRRVPHLRLRGRTVLTPIRPPELNNVAKLTTVIKRAAVCRVCPLRTRWTYVVRSVSPTKTRTRSISLAERLKGKTLSPALLVEGDMVKGRYHVN